MTDPRFEIRELSEFGELLQLVDVLGRIWGTDIPIVSAEMARAIRHSGGYVAGAFTGHEVGAAMVGASIGFLARHDGAAALHSHVTGLLPIIRSSGLGREMKLHQRAWAAANHLDWITWTFDPLVRRNAWFNIAVLGAGVDAYLVNFYGTMTDAINAGDDSDRLSVAWDVHAPIVERPRDGSDLGDVGRGGGIELVPTPADVVALRREDPTAVARWRVDTRRALGDALHDGRRVLGFTRRGEYVIGSGP